MKKAPKNKKKNPGYAGGGDVNARQLGTTTTLDDYLATPEKKKKIKDLTFREGAEDIGRFGLQTYLGGLGLDGLIKGGYNSELGVQANKVRDKYIEPLQKAAGATALNIVAPGSGTLYSGLTTAAENGIEQKTRERFPDETDLEYSQRMASLGIDITDTEQGLQGYEGVLGQAMQYGAGFAKGGVIDDNGKKNAGKKLTDKELQQAYNDSLAVYQHSFIKDPTVDQIIKHNKAWGRLHGMNKEIPTPVMKTSGGLEIYKKPKQPLIISPENPPVTVTKIRKKDAAPIVKKVEVVPEISPVTTEVVPKTEIQQPTGLRRQWDFSNPAFKTLNYLDNTGKVVNSELYDIMTGEPVEVQNKNAGGLIKGPGTGKSDSIPAKIKPNSFVVPEENAGIAKMLASKYLGKDKEVAKLNQGGGVAANLSNGEYLFTPEEKQRLITMGINVDSLAPDADTSSNYGKGGGVDPEKTKALKEQMTKVANMRMQNAEPDEIAAETKILEKMKADYVNPSKGEVKGTLVKEPAKTSTSTAAAKVATAKPSKSSDTKILDSVKFVPPPIVDNGEEIIVPGSGIATQYTPPVQTEDDKRLTDTATKQREEDVKQYLNDSLNPPPSTQSNTNKIGAEDFLAAGQIGLGVYNLFKDGKRPTDQIDPEFNSIVDRSKSDANFGFDNYTKSQYEKNIELGRLGTIGLAAQTAGADPTIANANARVATNDYASNLVKLASADSQLRYDKQRYSDSLVGNRSNMKRRLFEDKMNAFNANQAAGADLLGAGIQNFFGSQWRKDGLRAEENANKVAGYAGGGDVDGSVVDYFMKQLKYGTGSSNSNNVIL